MLEKLVKDHDILLVGENSFTFAVLLAVFRNMSWEGIMATQCEGERDCDPRPESDFSNKKLIAIKEQCIMAEKTQKKHYSIIESIVELPSPPQGC